VIVGREPSNYPRVELLWNHTNRTTMTCTRNFPERFYDQMQYASGIVQAFTYNFIEDVVDFFAQQLNDALK
jgi:hypothetical protein